MEESGPMPSSEKVLGELGTLETTSPVDLSVWCDSDDAYEAVTALVPQCALQIVPFNTYGRPGGAHRWHRLLRVRGVPVNVVSFIYTARTLNLPPAHFSSLTLWD